VDSLLNQQSGGITITVTGAASRFLMKSFVSKVINQGGTFAPLAIGMALLSFAFRYLALNQTDFGNGWDSYFYLVQIQAWHDTGNMHSPEWTLFYPLLLLVDLFTSDYVASVKILSALLASVFTWLVFVIGDKIQSSKTIVVFASAYTVFSPELTYFSAQWPKNLLGVILLMTLLFALWKNNWKWVVFFLIVGFFGHRMTAVLGLGIIIFTAFRKHISVKVWIGLFVLLCITLLSIQFIPGLLNLKDIQRLNHLVSFSLQFPVNSFNQLFGIEKISIAWQIEIWITFIVACLAIVRLFFNSTASTREAIISLLILFTLLWLPFYYWEVGNAAYRFFHVGILLTPLFLIFLTPTERGVYIKYLIPVIIVASFFSWKSYNPAQHDPNYALYKLVTTKTLEQIQQSKNKPELIIAHKSLAEFYSFSTKTDAMPWIPDYTVASNKLWRIAVLPYSKLFEHYTKQKPLHLTNNYYFVQETQWQQFVTQLKTNENESLVSEHLTWQNPNEIRPVFLRKK